MSRKFVLENIKLAAFDLDGTVLDYGQISSVTGKAIEKLKDLGIHIVVATGRNSGQLTPDVQKYFEGGTFTNGSYTKIYGGKILDVRTMPKDKVIKLFKKVKNLGGESFYFIPEVRVVSQAYIDIEKKYADLCGFEIRWKKPDQVWLEEMVEDTLGSLEKETRQLTKVECNFMTEESYYEAYKYSSEELGLETVMVGRLALEITPNGTSKATGLEKLASYYGVSFDEIIAFGDSPNDIPMLKKAGFSVCVGNVDSSVRAVSDYACVPVQEDGVAKAICHLFGFSSN